MKRDAEVWRVQRREKLNVVQRDSRRLAKILEIMEREVDVNDLETDVEAAKSMASDILQYLSEIGEK